MTRAALAAGSAATIAPGAPRALDLRPGSGPPDVAISVRGVSKRFVARRSLRDMLRHPLRRTFQQALRNVSCDIYAGEFFGLLGPNGAGKTTLFKTLATFITPDVGTAVVGGHDLGSHPEAVRQLVTPAVADERSLRWRLTARENLRLYARLYDVPFDQIDNRVGELLEAVGLHDTGYKLVGEFSTGMKQRLLIARALIPRPRILLLDEPTRGLDPVLARNFRRFLREEIGARQGCTVLLATHNAEEAFELCDRVAILERGRLLVVGSAETLQETFAHHRYRVWTRTPQHRAFDELERLGAVQTAPAERSAEEGWATLELELPRGSECAAEILAFLAAAGAVIARFERVSMSLADLIERVVQSSKEGQHG
ncbi:MAG: ABC transporter ATP-binding protein [Acidobacteria bacterium]|nr:ABC transporter ATP-binding protein [Acidobacteriota bacterium]